MPFGEYELSPSLIGLSLLHTSHREAFQRLSVRTSIPCYRDFILDMCRSLGFASTTTNLNALACALSLRGQTPCSGSLSLRMRDSCRLTSLVTVTRRFIMQKARRHCMKQLRPLVGAWFQELFHSSKSKCFSPFPHGTGSLSVSQKYLALPDGPGRFAQNFTCSALLRIPLCLRTLRIRDYHPL